MQSIGVLSPLPLPQPIRSSSEWASERTFGTLRELKSGPSASSFLVEGSRHAQVERAPAKTETTDKGWLMCSLQVLGALEREGRKGKRRKKEICAKWSVSCPAMGQGEFHQH